MSSYHPFFIMSTDLVPGKYQLTESENFENFMAALGIGYLTRKLGNQSKPLVTISQEGDEWTFKQESLVKTSEAKFSMGKQFEEMTADGRKVLTTNSIKAPNVLFQEMLGTDGGKDSFCTREFMAEKMKCVCTVDDVVTTRWYQRQ